MSPVEDLLQHLDRLDVRLWAEGGRLRYSAPEGTLTEGLLNLLRTHKAELLPRLPAAVPAQRSAIPRIPRDKALAPSFGQERLWFLQQLEGASAAYNIPSAVRIRGPLDIDAARHAFRALLQRHEVLRTRFPDRDGGCSVVIEPEVEFELPVVDACEEDVQQYIAEESRYTFDLAQAPLLRARILRLGTEDHVVLLNLHHIVSDGWSTAIFISEFCHFYAGGDLPPLDIQYADYAMYQRQRYTPERSAADVAFWTNLLTGAPRVIELPSDRPRPAVQSFQGDSVPVEIPAPLATKLREFTRRVNGTLYITLLSCFAALLHRYSRQTKVVIGSPVANRQTPEIEPLIGFFLNTLVLPVDVENNPSFEDLVTRVRQLTLDVLARQDMPFEHLVEALQPERTLSHSPLFQVMFILQNNRSEAITLRGLDVSVLELPATSEKFDLTLSLAESTGNGIRGQLGYSRDLFDRSTATQIAAHFVNLVNLVIEAPARPLLSIPLLSSVEHQQVVREWNDTVRPRPQSLLIHQMVEQQAARSPKATALVFQEETLSYEEFNARANQLAWRLRSMGVGPEIRVGICIDRSIEMMVALLAVLKAGGAYVPLDTSYPGERIAFMLADAEVSILLTLERHLTRLPRTDMPVLSLDRDTPLSRSIEVESETNPNIAIAPENLAYIIYTSGSTGRPKGVMNAHRGVVNRLLWGQETFAMQPDDSIVQKTPIGFDVSVWEMFWPLFTGARLVIAEPGGHRDSAYLVDLIERHGITMIHFVAPMLGSFLEEDIERCGTLRRVLTSGEALSYEMQRRFFDKLHIPLNDLYGPTEAAVEVSHWECKPDSSLRVVPIGRPISNTQLYILDRQFQPVPIGVPGELHIGGIGVARGYWGRPGLTAEVFVPDPFSRIPGARLYRTGDEARYLRDGNIDFLGRLDQQIKIRGFRVELGEIELALQAISEVREAVVLYRDKQLVAYIIPAHATPSVPDLREELSRTLPEHMIPAQYLFLDAFPIAPNGKLDRGALPAPAMQASSAKIVEPRTPAEAALAQIWADVLDLERVGIHDNFFAIGGDSISSTRIVARARHAKYRISLKQVFQHHTVAALAAVAEAIVDPGVELMPHAGALPLTPIQRRYLASCVDPRHYNQTVLLEVTPNFDLQKLASALEILVQRHDALRLRFYREDGTWVQQVDSTRQAPVPLRFALSELEDRAAELQEKIDPENGPVFQAAYFDGGPAYSGRVLLILHHLVVDGVSWRILLDDLACVLADDTLPDRASAPFAQWAAWLTGYAQSEKAQEEIGYWRNLAQKVFPSLPVDTAIGPNTIASVEQVTVEIDVPVIAHLHEALLCSVVDTLCGWTNSDTVLLELEGHGRGELPGGPDITETVGWFTTAFPAAFSRSGSSKLAISLVKHLLQAIPNRGAGCAAIASQNLPTPEVAFNYLGRFDESFSRSGPLLGFAPEPAGPMIAAETQRPYKLEITALVLRGRLRLTWAYSRYLHTRATIERLAEEAASRLREISRELTASEVESAYPLSPSQLGILLVSLARPGTGAYVEQSCWKLRGALVRSRLESAVASTMKRHASLRTGFAWDARTEPLQIVWRDAIPAVLFEDWRGCEDRSIDDFCRKDRINGFALDHAPLFRVTALQTSSHEWSLVVTYHHLILDGWSLPLVLGDVLSIYNGADPELTPTATYQDYMIWLRRQDLQASEEFWRRSLQGFRQPTPLATGSVSDVPPSRTEFELDGSTTLALEAKARGAGVTLNTLLQGAWALALSWWSGEEDVVFGQTVSGRPAGLPGVDAIAGMFVNTIPVRCSAGLSQPFLTWLQGIQSAQSEAETFSWCSAAQIHGWSEVLPSMPLYESILVVENYPMQAGLQRETSGFEVLEARASGAHTSAALTLLVGPGERLSFHAVVASGRWSQEMLARLLDGLRNVLAAIAGSDCHYLGAILSGLPTPPQHTACSQIAPGRMIAPRTVEELRLAAIWEEVLGVPKLGVRDNFFEIGGHSLLALHLIHRIESAFGLHVSLGALVQAPTIEAMAEQLVSMPARFSPLVPLQVGFGGDTPLFCIHPLGGSVVCYAELARLFKSERSLYALQARGVQEDDAPTSDIDAMAVDYINAIREAQPHGPYLLLGYSFGGYVALRMAAMLQEQGEAIERVILLDVPHPSVTPSHMAHVDDSSLLLSLFAGSLDLSLSHLRSMSEPGRLHYVFDQAREAGLTPPGMTFERGVRYFAISRANHQMNFAETSLYSFPITQIRAAEQANRISKRADLGWREYANDLDVIWTSGSHETMLNPPHVESLAAMVRQALQPRARRRVV